MLANLLQASLAGFSVNVAMKVGGNAFSPCLKWLRETNPPELPELLAGADGSKRRVLFAVSVLWK